jgi:hypothetical protein
MRPLAIAFRDSLNSDALMQVVLQGIDNVKKTSKTGVPGAEGAPDSRGQDGLAPPRIKKLALSTKEFDPWGT